MTQTRFTPSLLWQHGMATFKGLTPDALYISFFCFLVPQFIFSIFFGELSLQLDADLTDFGAKVGPVPSIIELLPIAQKHAWQALVGLVSLSFFYLIGLGALLSLAAHRYQGHQEKLGFKLFKAGLLNAPQLGFIFCCSLFIAAIAGSITPALIILTLTLIFAPAQKSVSTDGVISAVFQTLTLSFAKPIAAGRMAIFLHALATCSVIYLCLFVGNFLGQLDILARVDLGLARDHWALNANVSALPALRGLSVLLETCLFALAACLWAAFSTSACRLANATLQNNQHSIRTAI